MGYRDICTCLTERQWPHQERERAFEQQWPQDRERAQLEHTIRRQNSIQLVLLLSDTDMPRAVNPSTAGGRTTRREINANDHPSDGDGCTYPQAQSGTGKLYEKNMLNCSYQLS